jgi:septal ring factor EnvC (AmiA/AmiB activator)
VPITLEDVVRLSQENQRPTNVYGDVATINSMMMKNMNMMMGGIANNGSEMKMMGMQMDNNMSSGMSAPISSKGISATSRTSNYSNPAVDALRNRIKELSDKISSATNEMKSAQDSLDQLWQKNKMLEGMKAYAGVERPAAADFVISLKKPDGHAITGARFNDSNRFIVEWVDKWIANINAIADRRDSLKKSIAEYQSQLETAQKDLNEAIKNLTPEEQLKIKQEEEELRSKASANKIKKVLGWTLAVAALIGAISVGVVMFKKFKKKQLGTK